MRPTWPIKKWLKGSSLSRPSEPLSTVVTRSKKTNLIYSYMLKLYIPIYLATPTNRVICLYTGNQVESLLESAMTGYGKFWNQNLNLNLLIFSYIQVNQYVISLGTLVPNSRDRHEKQWRPDFTRHKTHPKIRFVWEKQTEVHF